MTDDNAENTEKIENATPTPGQTPLPAHEPPAETPPVDEDRAAEAPTADVAPVAASRTEEPVAAAEPVAEEPPPLPATPVSPPAGELVATAEAQSLFTAEHAAPDLEQPPPEETPVGAIPTDEAAAAETVPEPVAEAATTPESEQEAAPESAPTAAPEVPAEAEPEPEPKPKKTRKSKAAAAPTEEPAAAPDAPASEPADAATEPAVAAEPPPESKKKWYAVKIQSGREESIKAAIERKIKIEGLEEYFGQLVIPVEEVIVKKKVKVKNKKTGETTTQEKNVTKHNKKFPGYLFAEVEFNDEILYVFRETSGVGDFVGMNTKKTAGGGMTRQPPPPMTDAEVQSMLTGVPAPGGPRKGKGGKVVVKLDFEKGDKVRIRNGAFTGSEGEVKSITEPKDPTETPKITVEVTLWGRPVPVEVDYWEVDKV